MPNGADGGGLRFWNIYSDASECKTPRVDFTGCESDLILTRIKPLFSLNLNHAERKNM